MSGAYSEVDHWLRPNAANRVPRRLVCLDSEAVRTLERRRERHDFRLAVCSFDRLDVTGRPERETQWHESPSPQDLWAYVATCTSTSHRTVCFAHNLSYDLRLTAALRELPALGYECTQLALNDYSCWARFANGGRTLMLCDSRSWLTMPLDAVAGKLGVRRRRLPAPNASDKAWLGRCRNDVEVLRAAVLNLLAWQYDDELGDFRPTGHAQASAAFRHRFLDPKTILVHWDHDAREAERRSAWAGRAEVWRHGHLREPLYEYDYEAAYARLAERLWLPTRLLGEVSAGRGKRRETPPRSRSYLYAAGVETEVPTLPAELEGRIVWPVGRFEGVYWDCELEQAEAEGAKVKVTRAWLYEQAPVLRRWARWILSGLDGQPPGDDPLRRAVLKGWSRSLIGRFALRYPQLEHVETTDDSRAELYWVYDADRGEGTTYLQIDNQLFEQRQGVESQNSTPALMAAVMAHARVQLWRTMRAAGIETVAYIDTDSLLVNDAGHERLQRQLHSGHFPGLRVKARYRSAQLTAPRHIELEGRRRISGLPKEASANVDGGYDVELWESLPASLRRRRSNQVFVLQRAFLLSGQDWRRVQMPDGSTQSIRLPLDDVAPVEL